MILYSYKCISIFSCQREKIEFLCAQNARPVAIVRDAFLFIYNFGFIASSELWRQSKSYYFHCEVLLFHNSIYCYTQIAYLQKSQNEKERNVEKFMMSTSSALEKHFGTKLNGFFLTLNRYRNVINKCLRQNNGFGESAIASDRSISKGCKFP